MSRFVRAGAIAGGAGGLVMAIVLRLFGEGPMGDAIAIESRRSPVSDAMYSRATQQLGGMLGVVIYGLGIGIVVSVVLAALRHRLPFRDDWSRSLATAAIGFATVVLVPFLKYPANPPGVGDPATITRRTLLYVMLVAVSVLATALGWQVGRAAAARWRPSLAVPVTALVYVAVIGIAFAAFPGLTDKVDMPATLVWRFRLASLGGQVALWSVLGLTLGSLLERGRLVTGRA